MAKTRKSAAERTDELVEAAYKIAVKSGLQKVTRVAVAQATDTSVGLTNRYFADRNGLRNTVLEYAVTRKDAATLANAQLAGFELPSMPRTLTADVRRLVKAAE